MITIPRHSRVKQLKPEKEKILKAARRKDWCIKGIKRVITTYISSQIMEARRQWNTIKVLKDKKYQSRILYSVKKPSNSRLNTDIQRLKILRREKKRSPCQQTCTRKAEECQGRKLIPNGNQVFINIFSFGYLHLKTEF